MTDPLDGSDPTDLVRRGYDALSYHYERAYSTASRYRPWIDELRGRVPAAGAVLDLGCGSGVPLARALAQAGYRVTGVDVSDVQIRRARERVPQAVFHRVDATAVDFPPGAFAAVVCLYTLIHVPLDRQPVLLGRVAAWLRPGGWFLATTGYRSWSGVAEDWLASGVPMWWSHADAATYRRWITRAGLTVEEEAFVPEGDGGHALFWARRS